LLRTDVRSHDLKFLPLPIRQCAAGVGNSLDLGELALEERAKSKAHLLVEEERALVNTPT
jgi:hypothetical protein